MRCHEIFFVLRFNCEMTEGWLYEVLSLFQEDPIKKLDISSKVYLEYFLNFQ